ncbi:MAG: hypothetical protein ACR2FY_11835 [Pirellulaceae bacterium]
MEATGDIFDAADNQRLDKWRKAYPGFKVQEDPSLPPNGFRTAGDILFVGSDFYRRCFGEGGPDSV